MKSKIVRISLFYILLCVVSKEGFSQCTSTIPAGAEVLSAGATWSYNTNVWICPNVTVVCNGGAANYFLEANALMIVTGGGGIGSCNFYLKSGAIVQNNGGGSNNTYYETGASWSGMSTSQTLCTPLIYNYAGAPGTGCLPAATAGPNATICYGKSVTLTGSSGTTYNWSPSVGLNTNTAQSVVFTPPASGIYTFSLTVDASSVATLTVTVLGGPVAITANQVICAGNSQVLSSSGALSYVWKPSFGLDATTGSQVTASPPVGNYTYSVTGTDVNACSNTASMNLNVVSSITANAGSDISTCAGTNALLIGTGGSSYVWSPGTGLNSNTKANATFTITVPGVYNYTLTASLSPLCVSTDEVSVTVNSAPSITIGSDQTICLGDMATLSATGAVNYAWTPKAYLSNTNGSIVTSMPTLNGVRTYTVTGIDQNGCTSKKQITITVGALPTLSAIPNKSICAGDIAILSANGSLGLYGWTPTTGLSNMTSNSTTFDLNTPGIYTYTLTLISNSCNASKSDEVAITVFPLPTIKISNNNIICLGTTTQLSASGGDRYLWNTGSTSVSIAAIAATYSVNGISEQGCTNTATIDVINSIINASASDVTINQGDSITIQVISNGIGFVWSPSESLACSTCSSTKASPQSTTKYYVTITDNNDCTIRDSLEVTVKEKCGSFFVPSAFSPNGDNENDVLYLKISNANCIETINFEIYNRWGSLVFQTTDINTGWDGRIAGDTLNSGVFVYRLQAMLKDGTSINQAGNISLIK